MSLPNFFRDEEMGMQAKLLIPLEKHREENLGDA
jgi:hypothetical protein